jgi:ATP-binding cassette subfamily C protein
VSQPSLLILDEATSALDAKTEKIIDDNIRRRGWYDAGSCPPFKYYSDADEIIVLEKGKVVQRGTHEEMIQDPGKSLCKTDQAH